jgi:TRAP transporter 4TM/12TM fusion protein
LKKISQLVIITVTVGISLQSIYTAFFGVWDPLIHRPLIMGAGVLAALLMNPLVKKYPTESTAKKVLFWTIDLVMLAIILSAIYFFIDVSEELEDGLFELDMSINYLTLAGILVLCELTRRIIGWPLVAVAGACLIYVLFGEYLPGSLRHAGYDVPQTVMQIWFSTSGIFGLPMGVLLNLIFIFIVFGAILQGTGAGDVMLKFAFAATGRTRGGPAHAAIIASGIFGTMSGSVVANVVGTGSMTIPMSKKKGFSGSFAGAVEAAASAGGQIMPPVMGVAAFLMAEFTGVAYLYIIVAALVPAALYYISLFIAVSLEAKRLGMEPIPDSEKVKLKKEHYLRSLMFVVPVLAMIGVLLMGRSPAMAGFWATVATVVFAFMDPDFRANPKRLFTALMKGGVACCTILVVIGNLGLIMGAMDLTGAGLRFTQTIAGLAGESLFPALLLTMCVCLFLGMGMPTGAAYLIVVLVLGPAVMKLGVPILVIHLFVFYFGVMSAITPPVCLAAFAAAPIAEDNPMTLALKAVRISYIGFIIPFVFLYNPQLLIVSAATGGAFDGVAFVWILFRVMVALWLFTTALSAMDREPLSLLSIGLRLLAGGLLLLVYPIWQWSGLVLTIVILAQHHLFAPRRAAETAGGF